MAFELHEVMTKMNAANNSVAVSKYLSNKRLDLEVKIGNFPTLKKLNSRIQTIINEISFLKKEPGKEVNRSLPSLGTTSPAYVAEIDWSNIFFQNNFIAIFHNGHRLERNPLSNSIKAFNLIKAHYRFRNAPKLRIEVTGRVIKRIQNIEVLFYYIQFLQNSGIVFDKSLFSNREMFRKFTKSDYKRHLPNLFETECLSFLCEHSSEHLPIISIPELVKGINGQWLIHDSFLFPIAYPKAILWIWESVEESKATYIFKTELAYVIKLQTIFDYLTGETSNKRQSLIQSPNLKKHLNYFARVIHDTPELWTQEMKYYVN